MRYDAIIFDSDGVLVESTDIKRAAFAKLYASFGDAIVTRILDYHDRYAGISRFEKFRVWHQDFLGLPYNDRVGQKLSHEFSRYVFDSIVQAPLVAGVQTFLEHHHDRLPLFVASGTPEHELQQLMQARNLSRYFVAINGSPASKADILNDIVKRYRFVPERVLMVGDALADYTGAQMAGTAFLGRVADGCANLFPEPTETIADLTPLSARVLND